jgi:hypothetical protein
LKLPFSGTWKHFSAKCFPCHMILYTMIQPWCANGSNLWRFFCSSLHISLTCAVFSTARKSWLMVSHAFYQLQAGLHIPFRQGLCCLYSTVQCAVCCTWLHMSAHDSWSHHFKPTFKCSYCVHFVGNQDCEHKIFVFNSTWT